jgi:hypothetical protein
MTGDPGDPALADALPALPAPARRGRRSRTAPRLRLELVERTGLSLRMRVRLAPSARGQVVASLRRGQGRHLLRGRRRGGRIDLTARVWRPGRWRLVVRFEDAPGWADAALPTRCVRFALRCTRTAHRPS